MGRVSREDMRFAEELANEQSSVMVRYFHGDHLAVDTKAGGSSVTAADRAINQAIIEAYQARDRKVVGEEGGNAPYGTRDAIYVDPIDGTSDFVAGRSRSPRQSIAALAMGDVRGGIPQMGTISFPLLKSPRTYQAVRGGGAFRIQNGRREKLPQLDKRPNTGIVLVSNKPRPHIDRLKEMGFVTLGLKGAVFKASCVADPELLKAVNPNLNPDNLPIVGWVSDSAWAHDYAATTVLAREVGAYATGLNSQPPSLRAGKNGCIFAINEYVRANLATAMRP